MPEGPATAPTFDAVVVVADGADLVVGGLRLVERAAFTAVRAGARRVLFVGRRPATPLRLPDAPIIWHDGSTKPDAWLRETAPIVLVMDATVVASPGCLAALASAPAPATRGVVAPTVLWRSDPVTLAHSLVRSNSGARLAPPDDLAPWTPPPDAYLHVARDHAGRAAAERALYERLGRTGDGWFTRVVDRRFSRALTRLLLPTGISPNQVTIASIAIGVAGGLCFVAGTPGLAMIGALLFLASTIVDGCDGEIARLTFRESAFGARLDILGDNLVHLFLFGGIAAGLYRRSGDATIAALGVMLAIGVLFAMATVYACVIRRTPSPPQQRLYEAFASREFAYLLVALTVAGRLDWFLWLSAGGTYVFSIGLWLLGRRAIPS